MLGTLSVHSALKFHQYADQNLGSSKAQPSPTAYAFYLAVFPRQSLAQPDLHRHQTPSQYLHIMFVC